MLICKIELLEPSCSWDSKGREARSFWRDYRNFLVAGISLERYFKGPVRFKELEMQSKLGRQNLPDMGRLLFFVYTGTFHLGVFA